MYHPSYRWLLGVIALSNVACAQNATTAGSVSAPFPTFENLSLEWQISGDANANGDVSVRFRATGSTTWRDAMPLRRVPAGSNGARTWTNRHSGSLFGLQPATSYEIELRLNDVDGGNAQQIVTASTRAVPSVPSKGTLRTVTPETLATALSNAQPGDIIELGAGNYSGFTLARDGTATLPLTIRGTPSAQVTGEIALFARQHVFLTGLRINGRIRFNGSHNISITHCTIQAQTANEGHGIVSFLRSENAYIADNIITGTTVWAQASLGNNGSNLGEGILVTGPGHVIARNQVSNFRDNLSLLEDGEAVDQFSVDMLDNDLRNAADDAIEADFCFHNCRILRNRITNSFIAMSAQPSLGGPTYFIRNQAYNVLHIPFKLYRSSVGDVILHNTIVKNGDGLNAYPGSPINRALILNNIFLGGPAGTYNGFSSGSGRVVDLINLDTTNSLTNYNGYGTTLADFRGRIGAVSFNNLSELRSLTTESNAQHLSFAVFAAPVAFPDPGDPLVSFAPVNLNIAENSNAADRAVRIANINDGFSGTAPDLGALEATSSDSVFASGFE